MRFTLTAAFILIALLISNKEAIIFFKTKLYYHYKKNQQLGKLPEGCKFNIINFVDVEYSKRVNPIQQKYINNLAAASETAETLLESLQKGKKEGGGGSDQFFQTSAVNFLAACFIDDEQSQVMPFHGL